MLGYFETEKFLPLVVFRLENRWVATVEIGLKYAKSKERVKIRLYSKYHQKSRDQIFYILSVPIHSDTSKLYFRWAPEPPIWAAKTIKILSKFNIFYREVYKKVVEF